MKYSSAPYGKVSENRFQQHKIWWQHLTKPVKYMLKHGSRSFQLETVCEEGSWTADPRSHVVQTPDEKVHKTENPFCKWMSCKNPRTRLRDQNLPKATSRRETCVFLWLSQHFKPLSGKIVTQIQRLISVRMFLKFDLPFLTSHPFPNWPRQQDEIIRLLKPSQNTVTKLNTLYGVITPWLRFGSVLAQKQQSQLL